MEQLEVYSENSKCTVCYEIYYYFCSNFHYNIKIVPFFPKYSKIIIIHFFQRISQFEIPHYYKNLFYLLAI